jgi:hypothetical protein
MSHLEEPNAASIEKGTPNAGERSPRLFGLGAISAAAFVGGPLAVGYLAHSNLRLTATRQGPHLLAMFAIVVVVWVWASISAPPDALSQLAMYVPQVPLWCLLAWLVLRRTHRLHKERGGSFRSPWAAIGVGFAIRLLMVGINVAVFLLQP